MTSLHYDFPRNIHTTEIYVHPLPERNTNIWTNAIARTVISWESRTSIWLNAIALTVNSRESRTWAKLYRQHSQQKRNKAYIGKCRKWEEIKIIFGYLGLFYGISRTQWKSSHCTMWVFMVKVASDWSNIKFSKNSGYVIPFCSGQEKWGEVWEVLTLLKLKNWVPLEWFKIILSLILYLEFLQMISKSSWKHVIAKVSSF